MVGALLPGLQKRGDYTLVNGFQTTEKRGIGEERLLSQ